MDLPDEYYLRTIRALTGMLGPLKRELATVNQEIVEKENFIELLRNRIKFLTDTESAVQTNEIKTGTAPTLAEEGSDTGHVAVAVGVEDELPRGPPQIAEDLLLEEVWHLILSRFTDKAEVWNLGQTCELFQALLLRPSKNEWLFEEVYPLVFDYLSPAAILKCRQISSSWRSTVDGYFQNHPSLLPHNEKTHDPHLPRLHIVDPPNHESGVGIYRVFLDERGNEQPSEAETTLLSMLNHPANPLISRALQVLLYEITKLPESSEIFRESSPEMIFPHLVPFFKSIGKHVWYLDVETYSSGDEPLTIPMQRSLIRLLCQEVLLHTPNIRRLTVWGTFKLDENEEDANRENLASLFMSLPHFDDLETLHLQTTTSRLISEVLPLEMQLLTRYHNQLKCLVLEDTRVFEWEDFLQFEWPNLVELHVETYYIDSADAPTENLDKVLDLKAPQLRKLGFTPVEFDYVLEVINLLPCNIDIIRMRLISSSDNAVYTAVESCLQGLPPNFFVNAAIKTLEIDDHSFLEERACYSFLLRFLFVENINISRGVYRVHRNDELIEEVEWGKEIEIVEINRYMRLKQMYKSNIWELLPRLKVLTVEKTVYTREGYRHFLDLQNSNFLASSSN